MKVDASGTTTYNWDVENRLTSVVLPGSGGTAGWPTLSPGVGEGWDKKSITDSSNLKR